MHGKFALVGVGAVGPRGGRDIGIARRVDHRLGQHQAAAAGGDDHDAAHAAAVDQRPAADAAEPYFAARLEQFAPPPLHLLLDDPAFPAGHAGGEAHAVAPVVGGDGAHRAHAAQSVQMFDHQGFRPTPGRGDAGRRTARAAADDHHVVTPQHRQPAGLLRDRRLRMARTHAGQHLADFALRGGVLDFAAGQVRADRGPAIASLPRPRLFPPACPARSSHRAASGVRQSRGKHRRRDRGRRSHQSRRGCRTSSGTFSAFRHAELSVAGLTTESGGTWYRASAVNCCSGS